MDSVARATLQDERYLLLAALGNGGMATVYRAFDRVEQRIVALKVLSDVARPGPSHPLSEEFELWSRLRHRNVVRAYGLEIARRGPLPQDAPYLVLEHVDGLPVDRAVSPGRVAGETLERLSVEILGALLHVHRAGLVHRDVKPANVLVADAPRPARRIKLTDFGLATAAGTREPPGTLTGSIAYMAPETIVGAPVDGRADLYGLGVLLFHLATGRLPATGRDADAVLRWHLTGAPADPRFLRERFSPRLARFIRRLTARDPAERPRDASEALALLDVAAAAGGDSRGRGGERATRARLRLALDATRLGHRRVLRLPLCRHRAAAWVRELRVRSQILGLRFFDLGTAAAHAGASSLEQAVLGLLLDRPGDAAGLFQRHALDRALPLRLVSGLPVLERSPGYRASGSRGGVSRFLLECAIDRPLVLHAGPTDDPLLRRTIDALRGAIESEPRTLPAAGGLLLALRSWSDPGSPPP